MKAAVEKGDVKRLATLMRQDPGFNVNEQNGDGFVLLHYACGGDSRSAVIPLLLAHPDIDVNVKNNDGCTPFYWACLYGPTSCIREMLKDPRVEVNEPNNYGRTPLWPAARNGYLDGIKWWIASGREMDLGKAGDEWTDAIGSAKVYGNREVITLLERFKSDAAQTKHAMRVKIGWYDGAAAEVFALVVFVSDGLLQINETTTATPAARFFSIARRLPLELQMIVCYLVVGSAKETIPNKESEVAFKSLAGSILLSSFFTG